MAMGLMLGEFAERLHGQISIVLPARGLVEKALDEASSVHPSQSIILMEQGCPFMEHLVELEKERGIEGRTLFAVIHGDDGNWRVRGINTQPGSFALRKQLLPKCLGLRDEELSKACGIPDCVFVHWRATTHPCMRSRMTLNRSRSSPLRRNRFAGGLWESR